jgi:hypothetical protein
MIDAIDMRIISALYWVFGKLEIFGEAIQVKLKELLIKHLRYSTNLLIDPFMLLRRSNPTCLTLTPVLPVQHNRVL